MSSDWDGRAYGEVADLQQWLAERALTGLDLRGVRRVLDVGCGDGRTTARIAAALGAAAQSPSPTVPSAAVGAATTSGASAADLEVVGLDPSPRMLAAAASLPPSQGAAALRFEPGDVTTMAYAGFDLVVSFNALHWVLDQQLALDRIAAALVPTGRALLVLVCAGRLPSLERVATDVAAAPRWASRAGGRSAPFAHPEPERFAALAASAGLATTSADVDDLTWDFGSTEAFARWCRVGFGAWTAGLSEPDADAFVDEVVAAYEPVSGAPGRFRFRQLRTELRRTAG